MMLLCTKPTWDCTGTEHLDLGWLTYHGYRIATSHQVLTHNVLNTCTFSTRCFFFFFFFDLLQIGSCSLFHGSLSASWFIHNCNEQEYSTTCIKPRFHTPLKKLWCCPRSLPRGVSFLHACYPLSPAPYGAEPPPNVAAKLFHTSKSWDATLQPTREVGPALLPSHPTA